MAKSKNHTNHNQGECQNARLVTVSVRVGCRLVWDEAVVVDVNVGVLVDAG